MICLSCGWGLKETFRYMTCCAGAEKKIVFQQIAKPGHPVVVWSASAQQKSIKMLISAQRRHVVFTAVKHGSHCTETQCSRPQSAVCNTAWANLAVAFNCVGQTNVFVCVRVHIRVCVCEGQVEDGCRKCISPKQHLTLPRNDSFASLLHLAALHTHTHTHKLSLWGHTIDFYCFT